jgi:methylase of polypeptide subunit release factors
MVLLKAAILTAKSCTSGQALSSSRNTKNRYTLVKFIELISDNMEFRRYGDINVSYLPHLDGGGSTFGQEFVGIVANKIGPVEHLFEFCSGPAFIAFSLLSRGLCQRATLADINPVAVATCKQTIEQNGLQNRCAALQSDGLELVPRDDPFDLVVSNPPHWPALPRVSPGWLPHPPSTLSALQLELPAGLEEEQFPSEKFSPFLLSFDIDLNIHRRFYANICSFMRPGGSIMMQEHAEATTIDDFRDMISGAGLELVEVFRAAPPSKFYFIWSRRPHDPRSMNLGGEPAALRPA